MPPLDTRLLQALTPWLGAPRWRLALSGGLDSSVLLHLLVGLGRAHRLPPLQAIYVHHGLQAAAEAWPAHCQRLCDALGVPLRVERVQVAPGASLERAAREARYRALARDLEPGELVLTAQHRDDQAETLLFRLLRGAGARGLAAMPVQRALGRGVLVRPLLAVSRAELLAYAQAQGVPWVEDPSNADSHYARNYLRREVLPRLSERWPQAVAGLARSAAHLGEAQGLLAELAELDLARARDDGTSIFPGFTLPSLALAPLLELSAARQRNALSQWLVALTPLPDTDHWQGWIDLRDAARDKQPIWRLGRGELRRADGRLWWLSGEWLQAPPMPADGLPVVAPGAWFELPGNGRVQLLGDGPLEGLSLRYRQGGEQLQLPGRGRRDLKRLLNERAVPSFVRARLPLLYRGSQLVAVANLAQLSRADEPGWQLSWHGPTNEQGLS
ncbi:MAG: tRNA lysidine(34) synthetase TilS [Pseudomonas sp.]|uniref:tRNA lysidine(34) synthetase TilS n=1 Tax=Pseudomonas sp. TaxID=306 RepID=UPI003392EA88